MFEDFGDFEVAFGSVTGTNHLKTGKNNQDSYLIKKTDKALIALVADGCGSGKKSEVGANVGIRLLADTIAEKIEKSNGLVFKNGTFWKNIQKETVKKMEEMVHLLDDEPVRTVSDFFLFTIVGAVITEYYTIVFSFGDGFYGIDGKIEEIGPFPNDAPPYLAYNIIKEKVVGFEENDLTFKVLKRRLTLFTDNLVIATDGLKDLIEAEDKNIPGKEEKVGPLKDLLEEDKYFRNPDALRRKLYLINKPVAKYDKDEEGLRKEQGLLSDDTTLILIRRKRK